MPIDEVITKWCKHCDWLREHARDHEGITERLSETLHFGADKIDAVISDLQESVDDYKAEAEERFRFYGR